MRPDQAALALLCIGVPGTEPSRAMQRFLRAGGGGYILFAHNMASLRQVRALNAALQRIAPGPPPLALVDEEGGPVSRLGRLGLRMPAARDVGRTADPAVARLVGELLGRHVRAVGFHVDCAPVLDVDTCPDNPVIGPRALSPDPATVARLGAAMASGMREAGVVPCVKHFPGHGDTRLDSHHALPRLPHGRERLEAVELVPFRHVLAADRDAMVMTAHVVYEGVDPQRPATLSRVVVTELLRGELAHDGVVVTDDLGMGAIARHHGIEEAVELALDAGVDLVLVCHDEAVQGAAIEHVRRIAGTRRLPAARIARAHARLMRLRRALPAPPTEALLEAVLHDPRRLALLSRLQGRVPST